MCFMKKYTPSFFFFFCQPQFGIVSYLWKVTESKVFVVSFTLSHMPGKVAPWVVLMAPTWNSVLSKFTTEWMWEEMTGGHIFDFGIYWHSLRNQRLLPGTSWWPAEWLGTMSDPWREEEKDKERLKGGHAFSSDSLLFVSFHEIYFWHREELIHRGTILKLLVKSRLPSKRKCNLVFIWHIRSMRRKRSCSVTSFFLN